MLNLAFQSTNLTSHLTGVLDQAPVHIHSNILPF